MQRRCAAEAALPYYKDDREARRDILRKTLEFIAASYDNGIDLGRKGIDSYDNPPSYITSHPNSHLFEQMRKNKTLSDSAWEEIGEYLASKAGMRFIDLGCRLNLMFAGQAAFGSTAGMLLGYLPHTWITEKRNRKKRRDHVNCMGHRFFPVF